MILTNTKGEAEQYKEKQNALVKSLKATQICQMCTFYCKVLPGFKTLGLTWLVLEISQHQCAYMKWFSFHVHCTSHSNALATQQHCCRLIASLWGNVKWLMSCAWIPDIALSVTAKQFISGFIRPHFFLSDGWAFVCFSTVLTVCFAVSRHAFVKCLLLQFCQIYPVLNKYVYAIMTTHEMWEEHFICCCCCLL